MTDSLDPQDDAGTAFSEEEKQDLIPSYITLRSELNEAEQANILEAQDWVVARKHDVLDEKFLNALHQRMYGYVWRWAGEYRKTGKNIGVAAYLIPTKLRQLLNDCRHWIENDSFEPDEIAVRFHHRLVAIHCYPNGNGRHARFATDLLLTSMDQQPFSWGSRNMVDEGQTRDRYIAALRAADDHDISPLTKFVRT